MVKRNTVLDRKIHDAAYREFYEKGFQGASMRGIAHHADVTVGALYTRYNTKEEMFLACVSDLIKSVGETLDRIRMLYLESPIDGGFDPMEDLFRKETDLMAEALLSNYDQAVLLLHRGLGSGVEDMFEKVIGYKVEGLRRYLRMMGRDADPGTLCYTVEMHIRSWIAAINPDYGPETARAFMDLGCRYHVAGLKQVFGEIVRDAN